MPTIARDRLLSAPKPVVTKAVAARPVAAKPVAAKIASGWGQTLVRLPGDTLELGGKVVATLSHPVRATRGAWTKLRTNPGAVLKPAAMMAGMMALGVVFPRAMRVVGWGMTAMMAIAPTIRFAKAQTDAQLTQAAARAFGNWCGALNMLLRNVAIELARSRPEAVCLALHPGTVDTGLSAPFRSGVPGQRLFTPAYSAARLLEVIDHRGPEHSGVVFDWADQPLPW